MLIVSLPSRANRNTAVAGGFSLIEIAVVLLILSVLISIVAIPLSSQVEARRVEETRKQVELAKEAIMGFAVSQGKLPCPASATSNGIASYCTNGTGACAATTVVPSHGRCSDPNGFLPAVTLGISPIDSQGYAVDAWQDGAAARRVLYAVSRFESPAGTFPLTASNGIRTATMDIVAASPHLYICATGLIAAPPTSNCGVSVTTLSTQAAAVIYSLGKNGTTAFASLSFDEQNNQNGDVVFTAGDPNATFDDVVTWVSLNILFGRMVQANKLP